MSCFDEWLPLTDSIISIYLAVFESALHYIEPHIGCSRQQVPFERVVVVSGRLSSAIIQLSARTNGGAR